MMSIGLLLLFWRLFVVATVNCDSLNVNTLSGQVRGVSLRTLLQKKEYYAYRGIPYAKPPVGSLRYKVPVPFPPWRKTLQATDYGNSCVVLDQSRLFPLNNTQSEDCLFLNIFTPVTKANKSNANEAVMFFIHGGAFTEGDGTNGFYGADFIVEDDVVLVTINYRLGPFGFSNFDLKGYTGNMGFKDQQLALEWVKRNIRFFGGDPNQITVFGESAGGVAVHLQMLSEKSRKLMARAIAMSGSAFTSFALYKPNNHIELYKETFELDANATAQDVLQFMLTASSDLIKAKSPALYVDRSLVGLYFTAVIEDVTKAEKPFLTKTPREIYLTTQVNVDAMFGDTSEESIVLYNPATPYYWIEPLKQNLTSTISLPFEGLTLTADSVEYQEAAQKVYDFYFGDRVLNENIEILNIFTEMSTDINFVFPAYQSLKLQSTHANTYCYLNNLELNLNAIKITNNYTYFEGMAHFEDLQYLFLSNKYAQLYTNVLDNLQDPENQKTLAALHFVPKFFTDYAKQGWPQSCGLFSCACNSCAKFTNNGVKPMHSLRPKQMQFWQSVYDSVRQWIVNPI